jgi:hypothetical protein
MTRFWITLIVALLCVGGCFRPEVIRHPDAPMLVTGARRGYLRVSVFDRERRALVDAGWIRGTGVRGWTLSKYDWEGYVNGR